MTIIPTNTDIKSGGGNHSNPGNKLYTKLVSEKRKDFVLAHKDTQTKNSIAQSIYDQVRKQSPPGRFLEKKPDGSYSVKSREGSLKKIKKALNGNKAQIEQYFRLRGQFPPPCKEAVTLNTSIKNFSHPIAHNMNLSQKRPLSLCNISPNLHSTKSQRCRDSKNFSTYPDCMMKM